MDTPPAMQAGCRTQRSGDSADRCKTPCSRKLAEELTVSTWNIQGKWRSGKQAILMAEMQRLDIQVMFVTELKRSDVDDDGERCDMTLSRTDDERIPYVGFWTYHCGIVLPARIACIVKEWGIIAGGMAVWASVDVESKRRPGRPQRLFLVSVYAPTAVPGHEQDTARLYGGLTDLLAGSTARGILILGGDLNARIGLQRNGRELVLGPFARGGTNMNSDAAVDFAAEQELCFPSSWFRKDWRKTSTWFHASSRRWYQQDHFMVRQRDRFLVTDVASRNDSEIGSDHKLVVMHIRVSKPCRTRAVRPPRKFDAQAVARTE